MRVTATGREYLFSQNDWDFCEQMGRLMDDKNTRADTVDLVGGQGTHRIGLLGAYAYAAVMGVPLDLRITPERGDGGINFIDSYGRAVDVMVSRFWRDPYLKQFPRLVHRTDLYVLVSLNEPDRRAWVLGQATKEQLSQAKPKRWNARAGDVLSMRWTELDPLGTPPLSGVRSNR